LLVIEVHILNSTSKTSFFADSKSFDCSKIVRDYLHVCLERWIGCRGIVVCLPQSPDLTSCDILLGDVVKDRVYAPNFSRYKSSEIINQRI
jgi:hypothetical protein